MLLLFFPFFPKYVTMTVLVTITKTGFITMTKEQLTQKSIPDLSFYADVIPYACFENSSSRALMTITIII